MMARLVRNWLMAFIDPRRVVGILSLPRYFVAWRRYRHLAGPGGIRWNESYPCLTDWTPYVPFDPHYFYQACWAARKLARSKPKLHVDIGSSMMMVSVISAFVPTLFVDYRPLKASASGLTSLGGDVRRLPFADACISSLSSLHVIEHIGLGRYGDIPDPYGSVKASQELMRVLAPRGRLLLSTPLGRERVEFNAHRIFAPTTVISMFNHLELVDFGLVDDQGQFHSQASPEEATKCEYACGLFEFVKQAK